MCLSGPLQGASGCGSSNKAGKENESILRELISIFLSLVSVREMAGI